MVPVDTNRAAWDVGRIGNAALFWAAGSALADHDLRSSAVQRVVDQIVRGRKPLGTSLCVYPPINRDMRAHDTTWDAATFKKLTEFVELLHRAGATLLPGTEGRCSLGRELQLLSQAGISNAELLASVTIGTARFAELDRDVGSITVGKRADIILIDGDPLTRLEDLDKVTMVMRDGALFRDLRGLRASLPFLPPPTASR
jgi:imidazolonepropionase-like amidohydrolase